MLAPGGYLLITTHGDRFAENRLDGEMLERYRAGRLVVRWHEAAGTNTCAAFHPPAYVRDELARGFDVVDFTPGAGLRGARDGRVPQDVYLLRKPAA